MDDALVDIYGSVEVTLHSSMSAIDNMVANNFLRKIDVRIFKPNPIGSNRFDDEILEELAAQNAENMHVGLSSKKDFLKPSEHFKKYMYAATSHGDVIATAIDENNKSVVLSTEDKPMIHKDRIESKEPFFNALCRGAVTLWRKILHDGREA